MRITVLALTLCLGCTSPMLHVQCLQPERAADYTGRFDHVMELEDGTRTRPVEITWVHEEDLLFGVDVDEEGGPRLGFAVESRFDAVEDPESPCGLVPVSQSRRPATGRSHMRVDFSENLILENVESLVAGPLEPVPYFVDPDGTIDDRAPTRERDEDGTLRRLSIWNRYLRPETGWVFWVRHELTRVD